MMVLTYHRVLLVKAEEMLDGLADLKDDSQGQDAHARRLLPGCVRAGNLYHRDGFLNKHAVNVWIEEAPEVDKSDSAAACLGLQLLESFHCCPQILCIPVHNSTAYFLTDTSA